MKLKTRLAKARKKLGKLISENVSSDSGVPLRPWKVTVFYWKGQGLHETCGIGKTIAEAVRQCDAQYFGVYYPAGYKGKRVTKPK